MFAFSLLLRFMLAFNDSVNYACMHEVLANTEFSLEFGLGGSNKAVFSNCKWRNVKNVARIEDLVAVKAPFVARQIAIS